MSRPRLSAYRRRRRRVQRALVREEEVMHLPELLLLAGGDRGERCGFAKGWIETRGNSLK